MASSRRSVSAGWLVVLVAAAAGAAEPVALPGLARAPRIDGVVEVAEWAGALTLTEFRETRETLKDPAVPPGLRTEARLAQAPGGLCVAFRCRHDRLDQIVTAAKTPDGPTWADDSVELFLDAQGSKYRYYHLIANLAGAVYDADNREPRKADVTWDSGAEAAGTLLDDGYAIELMVPWTSLNLGLNRGGVVGLNLCRNVPYTQGRQSLYGEYHAPATWRAFRVTRFGPGSWPVAAEAVQWNALAGRNEVVATLTNLTDDPLRLETRLEVTQGEARQRQARSISLPAGKSVELRLPYTVTEQGLARFRLMAGLGGREVLVAWRAVQPQALAAVTMDSDVLERGESLLVTVSVNVAPASLPDYAVRFSVRSPAGVELVRREEKTASRRRFTVVLETDEVPADVARVEVQTIVVNLKTGAEVVRVATPVRLVGSPWADAPKE